MDSSEIHYPPTFPSNLILHQIDSTMSRGRLLASTWSEVQVHSSTQDLQGGSPWKRPRLSGGVRDGLYLSSVADVGTENGHVRDTARSNWETLDPRVLLSMTLREVAFGGDRRP